MKKEKIIQYIISFLLGVDIDKKLISYDVEPQPWAKLTIIDSGFFSEKTFLTQESLPALPLQKWRNVPLLFGNPCEEESEYGLVLHADIIASSFLLLTRYEELLNPERDVHQRFPAKSSLPYRAGFLTRPVVDEYGLALRQMLEEHGIELPPDERHSHVYLTHDVDAPWQQYTFETMIRTTGGLLRREHKLHLSPLLNYLGCYHWNPHDTFDFLFQEDGRAKVALGADCEDIYFLIGSPLSDKNTTSYINDKKLTHLLERFRCADVSRLGLHTGYTCGRQSSYGLLVKEKEYLEDKLRMSVTDARNHYLLSKDIQAFRNMIEAGFADDWTMGYADYPGFRLGTAHPVRWIDPERLHLTSLTLHPLICMEGTLCEYMRLNEQETMRWLKKLFQACMSVHGDYTVLFHNSIFNHFGWKWMWRIYPNMIDMICSMKVSR